MCEGASGSRAGLHCPHMAGTKLHSLKHPSQQARQRPRDADAAILCPLVFPSQLSLILWFVNSMET